MKNKDKKELHIHRTIAPPDLDPSKPKWIKILIFMLIAFLSMLLMTSCGTFKMTDKEKTVNYELEKLYLDYSYKRDSIIIEYNK